MLAQGNKYGISGTDTIDFIYKHEVPDGRRITYATYILDYRPLKDESYRVIVIVGGDRLIYLDDAGSPAENLMETKILVISIISHAKDGTHFMSAGIKNYFLATPMSQAEYMKIQYAHILEDIRQQYSL